MFLPGLVAVLARPAVNEVYLLAVSYVILATFLAILLSLCIAPTAVIGPPATGGPAPSAPGTATAGAWAAILFTYVTYALLPIRLQEAACAGALIATAQLGCAVALAESGQTAQSLWSQVSKQPISLLTIK